MAIEEKGALAGIAEPDDHAAAPTPGEVSTNTPVTGLRELTWEHVTNRTTSHPIVPGEPMLDANGQPRPAPIKIEDLLARPAIELSPMDPLPSVSTPVVAADVPPDAPPAGAVAASPTPPAAAETSAPPTDTLAPPAAPPFEAPSGVADVVPPSRSATPSALPSFADMLNAPPDAVGQDASLGGVDGLVKPIEEPPPVARDTDPEISGLAELILKTTPSTGLPRVESLRDSLGNRGTGAVPVVEVENKEPPVLDAAVEFANASSVVPVIDDTMPPPRLDTGVQPASPAAQAEAELNRLAYLPDQDDEPVGPVEVPVIEYSDVRSGPAVGTGPVLSQGEQFQPRQSAPVQRNYSDLLHTSSVPVPQRRKRHVVRKLASLVVLLAMVAGGLYAVKYFVLDRVQWDAELEPLAAAVEEARGLEFEQTVPVTPLPADEYASTLIAATSPLGAVDPAYALGEYRAVGLHTGGLDIEAIGRSALIDSPAFYDPATSTIYIVNDLDPDWYTFSMHRALAAALLDQRFDWSTRLEGAAPTVVLGTRALYEGDALAVALSLLNDEARTEINLQTYAAYTDYEVSPSSSPFTTYAAGRLGLGLSPYFADLAPADRDALEMDAAFTDGQVFDLRRLTAGEAASVTETSRGLLYWYHVLAARLDDDQAWRTALAWQGDDVTVKKEGDALCATAEVRFAAANAELATVAFTAWAAAAPAASATTVEIGKPAGGEVAVAVHACDPGPQVATNDGAQRLSLGGAPLRAEQYRLLLADDPSLAPTKAACAVYGPDPVTGADERLVVDLPEGWSAPAEHPAPNPAKEACAKA